MKLYLFVTLAALAGAAPREVTFQGNLSPLIIHLPNTMTYAWVAVGN